MAIHMAAQDSRAETVQCLVEEAGVGVDTVSGVRSLYPHTHTIYPCIVTAKH